jgi:MFS family permease
MTESVRYPGTRWLLLLSAAWSYIALQVANLSIAPLLPVVGKDLNLVPAQFGTIMSVYTLSGCVVMLWLGGKVVDKFGPLTGILIGMICAALPMTLMPVLGHSYQGLIWMRIIEGLAAGFAFPPQAVIIASWFGPEQKGMAGGLMGASVTLGSQVGLYGGAIPVENFGLSWQSASFYLSAIAWVGAIFVLIVMSMRLKTPAVAGQKPVENDKGLYWRCLMTPLTFLGIGVVFMISWVFHSMMGLTAGALDSPPPMGAGYTAVQASSMMVGTTLAGVFGPILGGFLLDKVYKGNPKANLLTGFALAIVFCAAMVLPAVLASPSLIFVSLLLVALGFQFVLPLMYVYGSTVYPLPVVAQMVGLWFGVGTFGGVIGQQVCPAVSQAMGSWNWLFILMAAAAFLGFFITLAMVKQKPLTEQVR